MSVSGGFGVRLLPEVAVWCGTPRAPQGMDISTHPQPGIEPGRQQHIYDGLDRLLTVAELSDYLGVPVKTIYDWRLSGHGPCAIRVGRHLKYAVGDVRDWLAQQREARPGHTVGRGVGEAVRRG